MKKNQSLKWFVLLLLGLISKHAISQDTIFSPQQLREDAAYHFRMLSQMHPNLYAFKSIEYVEQFKQSILDRLSTPMDKGEFSKIICQINHCFDVHTQIVPSYPRKAQDIKIKEFMERCGRILPKVTIAEGKVILKDSLNNLVDIRSINGVRSEDILSALKLYFSDEITEVAERKYEKQFSGFLLDPFVLEAPYMLKGTHKLTGKEVEWVEKGVLFDTTELTKSRLQRSQKPDYRYFIYPKEDIALLELNTFEQLDVEKYNAILAVFFDSISQLNLKNLFIDLRSNGGGQFETSRLVLNYLLHDTIFLTSEMAEKISQQNCYSNCSEEYYGQIQWLPLRKRALMNPTNKGYKGNIYVLQGEGTCSAADYLCRIFDQNKLGLRIGEATSTPLKQYTYTNNNLFLPNTKLRFTCAKWYWHIPVEHGEYNRIVPDLFHPIGNERGPINAEELKMILYSAKNKKE